VLGTVLGIYEYIKLPQIPALLGCPFWQLRYFAQECL